MIGLIRVGPRLGKFFFKVFVNHFVWGRRSGNGQNPILHTSFPFVDVWAIHIGKGMGDLLPWVHHDQVCGIHKLVKAEFMEKSIGLLLISIEDGGFFSLEGFFIPSNRVQVLWEPWQRFQRWCQRGQSSIWFLVLFWVWCSHSELVSCQKGPCKLATHGGCRLGQCHGLQLFWCCDGLDLGSRLVVRPLQVVVYISDSLQSSFDVIDWAGFSWW